MSLSYSKVAKSSSESQARLQYFAETGRVRKVRPRPGYRLQYADQMLTRPGPLPMPDSQRRSYVVSVRFNPYELAELDKQRNVAGARNTKRPGFPRGEWLRMCWQRTKPEPTVPEFNRLAYAATARSAANLTQISGHLDANEVRQQIEESGRELAKLRMSLLRATFIEAAGTDIVVADEDRRARRGPFPLPTDEVRDHVVCVRLNEAEMSQLNCERSDAMKGEWLRMVWQDLQSGEKIPEVSQRAYDSLAISAENINKIAHYLNQGLEVNRQIKTIKDELKDFRVCVKRAKESMR